MQSERQISEADGKRLNPADPIKSQQIEKSGGATVEQDQTDSAAVMVEGAREICARLQASGHRALLVGGCVRDLLLRLPIRDFDIATDAPPARVKEIFENAEFVGASFGVSLVKARGHDFEVVTFRKDHGYHDHRHPTAVEFGTLEDDARRRDFTVNALFEDLDTGDIIDRVGGLADLNARLIRCVGKPRERFKEDALRLLRAVRFAAQLDFRIERDTEDAIRELAHTVEFLSAERVRDELTLILTGPRPAMGLNLLDSTGLLERVLPEISAMKGVEQGAEHHPEGDVFVHTLLCLEKLSPRNLRTAWAALLHDVAKPTTKQQHADGRITFYDHERIGAEMARTILARLKFSNDDIESISSTVGRHMHFLNVREMRRSTLRRFIAAPTIEDDLALHRADCLAAHGNLSAHDFVRAAMSEFQAQHELAVPPPLVRGDDLIAMGVRPSPELGKMLNRLHDMQLEGAITTREEALKMAGTLLKSPSQ